MTLVLPGASDEYDASEEDRRSRMIELADKENVKKNEVRKNVYELYTQNAYVGINQDRILVDCTDGNVTIYLPDPEGLKQEIRIKRIDSSGNTVTIDGNGFDIDGSSTLAMSSLDAVILEPYLKAWWIW